jgi:hypothetical protein
MTIRDATATFKKVSELRDLCHALPHLPTEAEEKRLRRFEELVARPTAATADDIAPIVAGWRRWWREGRVEAIATMAERLPAGLVDSDRDLATYAIAVDLANASRRSTG